MINPTWRWTKDIDNDVLNEITDLYPVIHVCSGFSGIGDIRIDRYFDVSQTVYKDNRISGLPNTKADMVHLPIKSGCAAAVISDPPYDIKRYGKMYTPFFKEIVRILKPGGKLIFVSPWVIYNRNLTPSRISLRKPADTSHQVYKIVSISNKTNAQISDYC